ncbi:DUF6114 domain-containing protein [Streptacidiphilus sp. N1-3]|uniref:DUF6114 domain-containing protein n=1 Tax=Streptacidiphilus alkalitolerans TaxID=3342712 RepID=A0ABV6WV48_9ACTN
MTSATAHARPEPESRNGFSKGREAFRNWRRSRPFWGGLFVLLASIPIIYFPYNDMSVGALRIHMATTAGAGALVIGLLLLALGISVWFQPLIRVFAGIAAIVLSLVSLPVSNFGGFGLGLFPGLIGGALVCSWAPMKVKETAAPEGAAEAFESEADSEFEGPESKLSELMEPEQQETAVEQAGRHDGGE